MAESNNTSNKMDYFDDDQAFQGYSAKTNSNKNLKGNKKKRHDQRHEKDTEPRQTLQYDMTKADIFGDDYEDFDIGPCKRKRKWTAASDDLFQFGLFQTQ